MLASVTLGSLALVLLGPASLRTTARALFAPWRAVETRAPFSIAVLPGDAAVAGAGVAWRLHRTGRFRYPRSLTSSRRRQSGRRAQVPVKPGQHLRELDLGREHVVALAKHPAVKIRAVCDAVEERAREMAAAFRVPAIYADYEAMLAREELDGVCIATPNHLHAPMIRAAMRRGLHVMCEKPLALDADEARDLLAQARAAGLTHATNFSNRPNPAVHYVQEQLAAPN